MSNLSFNLVAHCFSLLDVLWQSINCTHCEVFDYFYDCSSKWHLSECRRSARPFWWAALSLSVVRGSSSALCRYTHMHLNAHSCHCEENRRQDRVRNARPSYVAPGMRPRIVLFPCSTRIFRFNPSIRFSVCICYLASRTYSQLSVTISEIAIGALVDRSTHRRWFLTSMYVYNASL